MITLTKKEEKFKISLDKGSEDLIIATAQWIDNGDGRDNDDLDLRAGLLLPDATMQMVHCNKPGNITEKPYIFHGGDVQSASKDKPGEETMKVNAKISEHYGGPVAIVFSIYSAVGNGAVSVASLKPKMKLQYQEQIIECAYDFEEANKSKIEEKPEKQGFFSKLFKFKPKDSSQFIYTYVIGVVIIKDGDVEIMPSGMTSKPYSEATPRLKWDENKNVTVTVDGPSLFKD